MLLNTCEESRQTKADCLGLDERRQLDELLRAAQERYRKITRDLISQPGPPRHQWKFRQNHEGEPEQLSHVDLEIGMGRS